MKTVVFIFVPIPEDWVAHASRVLVAVSRRNNPFYFLRRREKLAHLKKFATARTPSPTRETRVLPREFPFWTWFTDNPRPHSTK